MDGAFDRIGTAEPPVGRARAEDTIFALASGGLPAAIAIVRLSGPQTRFVLETMVGAVNPWRASLRTIRDGDGETLDHGLVLFFPKGRSFTGEDMAELHLHGGRAVVAAVFATLERLGGLRMAEPGEFARRSFLAGRLDLSAAEGLGDLIAAETEAQRRLAIRQADGGLRRLCEGWRERLLDMQAQLEARIDFADEGDVEASLSSDLDGTLAALTAEMRWQLGQAAAAEAVREGLEVVILGAPNAGKSSLLNALARRDVAIVSREPGTTRDLLEVRLDLGGFVVNVVDTAGLREQGGEIEREGIRRALERAEAAEMVIWLVAPGDRTPPPETGGLLLRVGSKADLPEAVLGGNDLMVSSLTGAGISGLLDRLRAVAAARHPAEGALVFRARQAAHIRDCVAALERARQVLAVGAELAAEELRLAGDAIGRVTGRTGTEDMLDRLFSAFCIGK